MPTSPFYMGNAGINAGNNSGSRNIYFTAGWLPGQIAIIQAICEGAAYDIITPTGWTLITSWTQGGDSYGAWFWKRLAHDDVNGGVTIDRSSSSGMFGIVLSTFDYCIQSGTPFETVALAQGTGNSASSTSITPTKNNCTVICYISVEDNVSIGTLAGGNYVEKYDLTASSGNGIQLAMDCFTQTTAANEAARASSLGGSDNWCTLTLAMYPISSVEKINGIALSNLNEIVGA
jgi:hypothetical protein